MEYTKNYHLPQWVEEDRIQMEDFNDAMASIENGLDAVKNEAAENHAELGEGLTALTAEMGFTGKNARIIWGSYTGTGKYGSNNKTSITTGFYPILVLVGSDRNTSQSCWPSTFIRGCGTGRSDIDGSNTVNIQWNENGVSWYIETDGSNLPGYYQHNVSGRTYYYCVIGYDKA